MVHICGPATLPAEAEESLEPWRWRPQGAEIGPLHSSLGNKSETPSQKNKTKLTFIYITSFPCLMLSVLLQGIDFRQLGTEVGENNIVIDLHFFHNSFGKL